MSLPKVRPVDKRTSTLTKVIDHVGANTIRTSKDIKVATTAAGSVLTINPNLKDQNPNELMRYKGEWDLNSAYNLNEVVYVKHDKTYSSASITEPAVPGFWICRVPVPNKLVSDQFIAWGEANNPQVYAYIRNPDAKYYPHMAETASYLNSASGSRWESLGGYPKQGEDCNYGTIKFDMVGTGSITP